MEEEEKNENNDPDLQEEKPRTEEAPSYPLNIMCSLYYESSAWKKL